VTLVSISDNFNRTAEALNKTGGQWVGWSKTAVQVTGNQAVAGAATTSGHCQHVGSYAGKQTVEMTIVGVGATKKARVLAGVVNHTTLPGSTFNIYASGNPSFYRWGAETTDYRLSRKIAASSGNTDLFTLAVTPAAGHKIKMTWDQATNTVEVFLDTGSGYGAARTTYVDTTGLAPDATQTRVGLHIEDGVVVDDWAASWETADGGGGGGSGGWEFSEWQGGTAPTGTEVSLTVAGEYDGANTDALNVAATAEWPEDNSDLPLVQPEWSAAMRDRFGINCHYKFSNSSTNVHKEVSQLTAYLLELKPGWVRDRLIDPRPTSQGGEANSTAYNNQMNQGAILQANDIGFHMSLARANWEETVASNFTQYFTTMSERPTWKWSAGGPNEPNDRPLVTNWVTTLVTHMQRLFDARAAAGLASSVPIAAPSLKDNESELANDFTALGNTNIKQYVDYADYHRYPLSQYGTDPDWQDAQPLALGRTPEYNQALRIGWTTAAFGADETFCTEGGFRENLSVNDAGNFLPADLQAVYAERLFLSLTTPTRFGGLGLKRFFFFELMDDPDPDLNTGESHWGLIFTPTLDPTTWSRKPAFTTLKTLLNELVDTAGRTAGFDPVTNPFTPPQVRFQATCSDTRFRHLLVSDYSGQTWLYYWLDKALWDTGTDTRINDDVIAGEQTYTRIGSISASAYPGGQTLSGCSGSAESRQHPNSMYMHMERDNSYIWLFDNRNMAHKKTLRLMDGASPWADGQWEDCAYDDVRNGMWVAHCGANSGTSSPWDAAFFTEPVTLGAAADVLDVAVTKYKFQYATGAQLPASGLDCECMMVSPAGRLYFVDKRAVTGDGGPAQTTLWQAPASLAAYPTVNTLTPVKVLGADVGSAIGRVTRGDWNQVDNTFVVADNFNDQLNTPIGVGETDPRTWVGHKFDGTTFDFIETVNLPVARKLGAEDNVNANPTNENLHFSADGLAAWVSTEASVGLPAEVWRTDFATEALTGSQVVVETSIETVTLTATPRVQRYVLPDGV
jgi:hypothetical protein